MGNDAGGILGALAAGGVSAVSPVAARGVGGLLDALRLQQRSKYENVALRREQRISDALADEQRRKAQIEAQTVDFLTKNTEYGEPGQPFRPPAAGAGRGIPEQQAQALKLLAISQGAGPALERAGTLLGARATTERKPSLQEALGMPAPEPGTSFTIPTEQGISVSRTSPKPEKVTEPRYIDWGYGQKKKILPDGTEQIVNVPVAPREPKDPAEKKVNGLTQAQRDNIADEVARYQDKIEEIRSNENLTDVQMTARINPLVARINAKRKLLGEGGALSVQPMKRVTTKQGDAIVGERVVPAGGGAPAAAPAPGAPVYARNPQTGERMMLQGGRWVPAN